MGRDITGQGVEVQDGQRYYRVGRGSTEWTEVVQVVEW